MLCHSLVSTAGRGMNAVSISSFSERCSILRGGMGELGGGRGDPRGCRLGFYPSTFFLYFQCLSGEYWMVASERFL